ncbi:MAG: hypothetical protein DWQ10_04170 [Calditrichaeota bacterium]|nr:MAG: hypothetical protein DWQ10_04170 [Calditrichota bacterium]
MAFKPSKRKKHNIDRVEAKLSLNSMMDIFIIILLFLLKTYSAHGSFLPQNKNLQLPTAAIRNHVNVGLELVATSETIFVEKQPVVRMQDVNLEKSHVVADGIILPLFRVLHTYAIKANKLEKTYGIKFTGSIVIKADKNLDYRELVRVMQTCGKAKYHNIHLAVANK